MKLKVTLLIFMIGSHLFAKENKFNSDILPIGNPDTKFLLLAVEANKTYQTATGIQLSEAGLIDELSQHQIILLGESHTSDFNHQVQLQIIKGLIEKGFSVCLALEFFTSAKNNILSDYVSGKIDENQFLDLVDYFNS